jgi:hypothetical protein
MNFLKHYLIMIAGRRDNVKTRRETRGSGVNYRGIQFSCYSGVHGLPSGVGVFFGPGSEAAVAMQRRTLVERRIELEELNTHSNMIEKQTANS